jgi:hypothetical protein
MRDTEAINQLRSPVSRPPSASRRPSTALAALRRFVRPRAVLERCELCGVALPAEHPHLLELSNRRLACACAACAVLFDNQSGSRYRRVTRRVRHLADFRLDEAQWAGLTLPINLAFFFHSSAAGKTLVYYPSPAGPTESPLDLESWAEIVRANPVLNEMEPDVEAFLVNRIGEAREYYLAPIDECYKLIGLIRANWRGLSGGAEVWAEIGRFFTGLKERAATVRRESHA